MTLLGHKGDKEPYVCSICGREAGSYGTTPSCDRPIMWLCQDPTCLSIAERVYRMKPKELSRYESQAVKSSTAKVMPELINALCTTLFENGAADLNKLTPEQFDKVVAAANARGEIERIMAQAFEHRADKIKEQIIDGAVPF